MNRERLLYVAARCATGQIEEIADDVDQFMEWVRPQITHYAEQRDEIERLRKGLQLIATDEWRLMNITARQTAASILAGKPSGVSAHKPSGMGINPSNSPCARVPDSHLLADDGDAVRGTGDHSPLIPRSDDHCLGLEATGISDGRIAHQHVPAVDKTGRVGVHVHGDIDRASDPTQPQPAAPSELVATLREIAVRALAVGPKDHNITLDEIRAISDAAERLAQPPPAVHSELELAAAHYVRVSQNPNLSRYITENGRHPGSGGPWAELVSAVDAARK